MDDIGDKDILASVGLKNTKQREMIIECLKNTDTALSAEDIFIRLKNEDKSIWFSTVYRALGLLSEKGILNKTIIPNDNKAYFELNRHHHCHRLVCLKCKKVIDIEECPFEAFKNTIINETGFEIKGHSFEVYGLCKNCKK